MSVLDFKTEKQNKKKTNRWKNVCFKTNPYSITLYLDNLKSDFVFESITAVYFGTVPLK